MVGEAGSYDDFFDALGQRESSDNYQAVNQAGFAGRYQLGEFAFVEIGLYEADGAFEMLMARDQKCRPTQ